MGKFVALSILKFLPPEYFLNLSYAGKYNFSRTNFLLNNNCCYPFIY